MLNFPNPSRSFDASRSRVRFWGYEGAMEISFFVEEGALRRLCPEMSSVEAGFLGAFDAAIKRIHKVAAKVHARAGKGVFAFSLAAGDF
jgi:Protein of unknown function (DUF1488)